MSLPIACEADRYADRMICGRCDHSWTDEKDRPSCLPLAKPHILLAEMITAVRQTAEDELAGQRGLVNAEIRTAPYRPTLRKCAVLNATATLLERVSADKRILALLKEGR